MRQFWAQWWFLLAVVAVLAGGLIAGLWGPRVLAEGFLQIVRPNITTAIVLFLMAYSLDSTRLRDALRHPSGAVWGSVVNLALLPGVAAACALAATPPDFAVGLIIASVSPCTLATASVFTRRAGGNDAISLVVTLVTNIACVAVTPLWLQTLVAGEGGFDTGRIVSQLVLCVLLPTAAGQMCLLLRTGRELAQRFRGAIGGISQSIVLLIVLVAAVGAGRDLRTFAIWPTVTDLAVMAGLCAVIHGVGLGAGWFGGGWLNLSPEDRIATAIAGAQKTLPVGLLIATNPNVVPAGMPFVTFPLLMYHALQLVLDTAIADAWRARRTASIGGLPSTAERPL